MQEAQKQSTSIRVYNEIGLKTFSEVKTFKLKVKSLQHMEEVTALKGTVLWTGLSCLTTVNSSIFEEVKVRHSPSGTHVQTGFLMEVAEYLVAFFTAS